MTASAPPTEPAPFSLLDERGAPRETVAGIDEAAALRLHRSLLTVRLVDERMLKMQRQGRLGFYMMSTGEEATHLAVHALRETDWLFPSYREPGALFHRGYTLREFVHQLLGDARDTVKGRQMPVHHSARRLNIMSISSPVGTQIPQAVGVAMAARLARRDDVALTYFGEGTSSTGEFHVGLNFAGVFKAPCVFLCRNNSWAISTPRERQTASRSFADKAVAYGMPGVRVDGNDLLAVLAVTGEAVARARAGDGPTLIEAVTYRRGAHSSSDDPSAYRDAGAHVPWEARDPIERWRRFLAHQGWWSEAVEAGMRREIAEELGAAIAEAEAAGPPPVETMFDDVCAAPTPQLEEQRRFLLAQPRARVTLGGH